VRGGSDRGREDAERRDAGSFGDAGAANENDEPVVLERTGAVPGQRVWEAAGWQREPDVEAASTGALPPVVTGERKRRSAPDPVVREIEKVVGRSRGGRVEQQLMEASRAFERERYSDALRILRTVLDDAPDLAAAHELMGLCLYRQEKWAQAIRHLSRFGEISGSVEQHPVLSDCHRALRHYSVVETLWNELAESSPSAELVAEGRIVMAGALADQGRLDDAIRLLERARAQPKRARPHHLRLAYALADCYERAGDVPRARELFARVLAWDASFADTADRVTALG
jgi:thioredoxin-like negative regulator of GroEL